MTRVESREFEKSGTNLYYLFLFDYYGYFRILSILVIFHYTMITLRRPDLILFNIT